MVTPITPLLDRIERSLPEVPRRVLALNRAAAAAGLGTLTASATAVCDAAKRTSGRVNLGTGTVTGQAASVARRVEATAKNGMKEVAGQARAQTKASVEVLEDEALDLLAAAEDTVEGGSGRRPPEASYDGWTKAQLYDRARELDIPGRSSMSRAELIQSLLAG